MTRYVGSLREVARAVTRRPVFSVAIVLTLALGIGVDTAVFSVVKAVLLEPLPYRDADRLVLVRNDFPDSGDRDLRLSSAEIEDLRGSDLFADVAGIRTGEQNAVWTLETEGRTERIQGAWVTASFFEMLGTEAIAGRLFGADPTMEARSDVVVLEHDFWTRRFGADPAVIGSRLVVRGEPREVVGVLRPGVDTDWGIGNTRTADLWVLEPHDPEWPRRRWAYNAVGRLPPGLDLEEARRRIEAVADGFAERHPEVYRAPGEHTLTLEPLLRRVTGDVRTPLWVLLGAVGVILLIACANVASLLLARAEEIERELAVRSALGAGSAAVATPLVLQTILLTALGATLGIGLAHLGTALVRAFPPRGLPRVENVAVDGGVLAFAAAVTVATAVIVSLLPGLRAARVDAAHTLRSGGRSGSSVAQRRLRRGLVAGEVALAVVLSVSAGLLVRSFERLSAIQVGFAPDEVLSARMDFPTWQYPGIEEVVALERELIERVEAVPGVRSAALAHAEHPLRLNGRWYFAVEGRESEPEAARSMVGIRVVSPGYLRTLGVPLLQGRSFDERDVEGAPLRVLVTETLARRRFGDEPAVGRRLRLLESDGVPAEDPPLEIIGVVGDVKNEGLREPVRETLILPLDNPAFASWWRRHMTLHVRTDGPPLARVGGVRRAVSEVAPELVVYDVRPLRDVVSDAVATPRFLATLVSLFAVLALGLAAIGTAAVTAYGVARRSRELGIRTALGADRGRLKRMVVGENVRVALWGLAAGVLAAVTAAHLLRTVLYEVRPADPVSLAAASGLMLLVVGLAAYLPARRASRVEPTTVLRND